MRKLTSLAFAAILALPAAQAEPYADGDVVVFFGDSITHAGHYHEYVTDYYRTRFPEARIRFVNSGIGGDTAEGARKRIPEDIAEYVPTHVAIAFGMNDARRGSYAAQSTSRALASRARALKRYETNLGRLAEEVRAAAPNARLAYLTVTPYDDTVVLTNQADEANCAGCRVGLSLFAGLVIDAAAREGVQVVDWYSPLNNFVQRHQRENPQFSVVASDRTHPTALGHAIMAWEFLKAQNAPAVVSEVEIDAKGGTVAKAENGEVTGLKADADGVSFELLAKALPLPVCEEARPYLKEFDVERTLNREIVRVTGLAAGTYALKIDGVEVGRQTAEELAEGVGLGFNEKTPQYRQAQEVARRNAELWERERVLRDHHSARWFFFGKAKVDDMAAFRAYYEENVKEDAPEWVRYFGAFVPGYLEYWPKYKEVRAELWKDQDAVRRLAKPVPHTYEIRPI